MLPGLGLGADVNVGGIILPARRRLLAGWSEDVVLMEMMLSDSIDWRIMFARQAKPGCLVTHREAAHGRA